MTTVMVRELVRGYATGLAEGLASRPSVACWKIRLLGQNSASAESLCST
jgi:hypothetical protein